MQTYWKNDRPAAPFYAVIFISRKSENLTGYAEKDDLMMQQAQRQEGYLGYSSLGKNGQSIFISYWQNNKAIDNWRHHSGHQEAKAGAKGWYTYYHSLICKVESHHEFEAQLKSTI